LELYYIFDNIALGFLYYMHSKNFENTQRYEFIILIMNESTSKHKQFVHDDLHHEIKQNGISYLKIIDKMS
jgi:hypothetical protein